MKRIFDASEAKHVLTNVDLPVPKNIIVHDLTNSEENSIIKNSSKISKDTSTSTSSAIHTQTKSSSMFSKDSQLSVPYAKEKKKRPGLKKKKKKVKDSPPPPPIDLENPVVNTTECIQNVIKEVKAKTPKGITMSDALESEKKTLEEKVTRHMNFGFDKKIYKELISLKLSDKKMRQHATASFASPTKDKVPKLEEFYKPKKNIEYNIPTTANLPSLNSTKQYDGLRITKVMKTWKDSRPD